MKNMIETSIDFHPTSLFLTPFCEYFLQFNRIPGNTVLIICLDDLVNDDIIIYEKNRWNEITNSLDKGKLGGN